VKDNIAKIRAALELARDYITSDLASERGAFEGYEGVSRIGEIKADLTNNEEALAALAELERAAAEPVTYQYSHPSGAGKIWRNEQHWNGHTSADARALYAAPPPAKPAMGMFAAEEAEDFYFQGFDACYNADDMGDMDWHGFWLRSKAFKMVQERTK